MMRKLSTLAATLLFSGLALAGAADKVSVQDPQVRLMPPGAPATAAFMVLKNAGDKDAKLVKAENPVSRVTEIHSHVNDGGVMRMRPVPAIDIKAGGETVLKPGGLHIMLIDIQSPLKEGSTVPITLEFDDGSSKKIEARVVRPMAGPMTGPMSGSRGGEH